LDVALVISGDAKGAAEAIRQTSEGVKSLGEAADNAARPVKEVGEGVSGVAGHAPKAKTGIEDLGDAVDFAKGKFSGFQIAAVGAFTGRVAGIANAGFDAAFGTIVTAAKGYFDEITNSADNIESDLSRHKGLIGDIKDLWKQADGAASNYGLTTENSLRV